MQARPSGIVTKIIRGAFCHTSMAFCHPWVWPRCVTSFLLEGRNSVATWYKISQPPAYPTPRRTVANRRSESSRPPPRSASLLRRAPYHFTSSLAASKSPSTGSGSQRGHNVLIPVQESGLCILQCSGLPSYPPSVPSWAQHVWNPG